MNLRDLLLGRRLASREADSRKIGWFEAVPAMGLDGLGSASYGPEAALTALAPLGAASLAWIGPVMGAICLLLLTLYLSYRQTLAAYPGNGGAYVVARENLGRGAGLLAASAIMIDYVLNVAVGVSAGVGALTSTVPALAPWTLPLCLAVLAVLTLANLRGTAEAGLLFAVPAYAFLILFFGLIGTGLWRALASGGHPLPVAPPPPLRRAGETAGAWVILRAFASGCTAMTGVEAVSNGVGSFRPPVVPRARRTLTIISAALGLLLLGVATLVRVYRLGAMDQTRPGYQSVLSQLVAAVAGRGAVFDVAMASVLAVLCLSANTSFVAFPRLCRVLAEDGYLPRPFAQADRRLVFSVGIGFLAVFAGALLVAFGGVTDRLIPLFAIGAFATFTMSQAGMVARGRRAERPSRAGLAVNLAGALATGAALVVIVAAKFREGAWITLVAAPAAMALLLACRRYYDRLDADLQAGGAFELPEREPPTVLVALEERSRMADRALQFAMTLSPDVIAVHLLRLEGPECEEDGRRLRRRWEEEVARPLALRGVEPPRLVLLPTPYREIHGPFLKFIEKLDADTPGRSVAVLIPELVLTRPWERLLHARRAERLRAALLRHGGPRLTLILSPWRR